MNLDEIEDMKDKMEEVKINTLARFFFSIFFRYFIFSNKDEI
jgi:hypothetical protein